ncbi:sarcosine oxidase subunit alpha family protein [Croceicoccus ponticola]|uniref:Sarcosine oxidase subunit alpha family protein n=1 Tax=Croceicoccus ponticola TaxID=2217664 RepID=A0A437GU02_9SPHN|nr:sarcosine oxidase subunit alpha family protein [Croceicoccus ponticola]RVQ64627.1 sarcosine oxidase subunit alpha family protein [Croceicoccus ponticola]
MTRKSQGGLVDRALPISFTFNGRPMQGYSGDTLASALIANGVKIVGRSFKYHRPRGILTDGADEPNALLTLHRGARALPNSKAPMVELVEGLEAFSQNCWPSPRFDLMAINGLFSPIFVAGFYYKTFMWPAAFWERVYEPLIRRAAGLGKLSDRPDPDTYDRSHAFADVLVVGAGAAGLTAALAAARLGKRVILVDQDSRPGGRLLAERCEIDGRAGAEWASAAIAELAEHDKVTVLTRTALFGAYDGRSYGAVEQVSEHLPDPASGMPRQRYWKIVAEQAIFATGATERPIAFTGNDRPGVMMASAVQTYVNRFAALPGRRAAVFTQCDSGYAVAADLAAAGVEVVAIIDPRSGDKPGVDATAAVIHGEVVGTHGKCLKTITVRNMDGKTEKLKVDLLAVAGGWNPNIGFASHLGQRPAWSEPLQAFVQDTPPDGMHFVGAAAGRYCVSAAIDDARGKVAALFGREGEVAAIFEEPSLAPPLVVSGCDKKAFVDFQHDVTVSDVVLAEQEGYASVEHLKRYTTLGMATDQGKIGQVLGHALLARQQGKGIAAVGTIAARPPHTPVCIGALAGIHRGEHLKPTRLTPTHDWAASQGASFVNAGLWKRAQWYTRPGDADWIDSAVREAKAVRSAVGICDVSTLGKIEVAGPDAALLLDRLYCNAMASLAAGKVRYGVMLREDGFVFDDGTVARIADDRFVISTTTANAVAVMRHIDYALQVIWPDLDAKACSVTENWAQVAVAGPNSRALLQRLLPDIDLSNSAFPFMGALEGRWSGAPMRLFRISFSGELAYEIAVPTGLGDALMRMLTELGSDLGCTPYGLEALGILRIEKGHAAGGELNGQVTAGDLGLGRMVSKKKDFIGRALAERPALAHSDRQVLVGLAPVDPSHRVTGGSHILPVGVPVSAVHDAGHVTSVAFSPTKGRWIALGLLARGADRIGEVVNVVSPVRETSMEMIVSSPVFVDPEGERLRG